jgi:hypothetical protein
VIGRDLWRPPPFARACKCDVKGASHFADGPGPRAHGRSATPAPGSVPGRRPLTDVPPSFRRAAPVEAPGPATKRARQVPPQRAALRRGPGTGPLHLRPPEPGPRAGFLDRWLRRWPSALLPQDRRAGFGYRFSIRQMEVSHTAVFDRPQAGRRWFEAAIREHLDLGRPEQVTLIVNRMIRTRGPRPTPGRFETRVVTRDVDPQIVVRYKASKVKAYFKEQRALRVETTINDPNDFGVGRPHSTGRTGRPCASSGPDQHPVPRRPR